MEKKQRFVTVDVDVITNGRGVFEAAVHHSQCLTVPQLFVHGQYVGGYDEVYALHVKGELNRVLLGAGA